MYFNRIRLAESAESSSDFWQIFGDPYRLHQSIWELFGDHADRRRDFLYRVHQDGKRPLIYAISAREPNRDAQIWQIDTKPYKPKISPGMRLAFLLRANAIRTRNGKRHDVVMEAKHRLSQNGQARHDWPAQAELAQQEGEKWLMARCERCGFKMSSVRIDGHQQYRFFKKQGGAPVQFSALDFTGLLTVTDPECFLATLYRGIGAAKGFGCGMLMVRPV